MLAVMVVVPVAAVLAMPLAEIVATFTLEELQVTCVVRISVVPSLKLPVATKGWELPKGILASLGVTVMETKVAFVTVKDAVPTWPENSAVIVASPGTSPIAKPWLPGVSLTVATVMGDAVHDTELVRFCVLPSANTPVAVKGMPVCCATVAVAGVIWIEVRGADSTTRLAAPLTEPC